MLLVFENGRAEPVTLRQYRRNTDRSDVDDHLQISINAILQDMYPDRDLTPVRNPSLELNEEEMLLLFIIRTGNCEQITVRQKDGRIELIESSESVDPGERVVDILNKGDFQDISIKQRDGKVVSVKRSVQTKP